MQQNQDAQKQKCAQAMRAHGNAVYRLAFARMRNKAVRSELKTAVKRVRAAVEAKDAELAQTEANKAEKPAEAPKAPEVPAGKIDFSHVEIEPLFQEFVDFETFSKSDFRVVKVKACEAVKKSKKLLKFVLDDGTGTDRVILSGIHDYYEPEELIGKTCVAIVNLPPRPMMGIDSCGMLISAVHQENGKEGLNLLMLDDKIPAGAKLY